MAFHLPNMRSCYGDDVLLSTEEYEEKYKEKVKVGRLQCWHGPRGSCESHPWEDDAACPALTDPATALPLTAPNDTSKVGVVGKILRVGADSHLAKMFGGAEAAAQGACLVGGSRLCASNCRLWEPPRRRFWQWGTCQRGIFLRPCNALPRFWMHSGEGTWRGCSSGHRVTGRPPCGPDALLRCHEGHSMTEKDASSIGLSLDQVRVQGSRFGW